VVTPSKQAYAHTLRNPKRETLKILLQSACNNEKA
jgi:hypothetical protein